MLVNELFALTLFPMGINDSVLDQILRYLTLFLNVILRYLTLSYVNLRYFLTLSYVILRYLTLSYVIS